MLFKGDKLSLNICIHKKIYLQNLIQSVVQDNSVYCICENKYYKSRSVPKSMQLDVVSVN